MTQPVLEDHTAIVTGSGRGIGEAISVEFADHGANVVVTARTREEIEATARTIREAPRGTALAISRDVTNPEHVDWLFDETRAEFGGLDILVNNAAIMYGYDPLDDSLGDIYELMDVGLYAAVDYALHAAHEFRQEDSDAETITGAAGRVLNISSLASRWGSSPM